MQAYGNASACERLYSLPNVTTVAYPPRKAKDDPKKAGTLYFVIMWKRSVPSPAKRRVDDTDNPVIAGTKTVAPNIANICCKPSNNILARPRERAS